MSLKLNFAPPIINNNVIRSILPNNSNSNSNINIIEAPAGYGKTYFAQQLADTQDNPILWYQVGDNDNDLNSLIFNLLLALAQIKNSDDFSSISKHAISSEIIAERIKKEFKNGLTIVFDDLHIIDNSKTLEFITSFVYALADSNTFFILVSREKIEFTNQSLFAHKKVMIFTAKELLFSIDELEKYLKKCNCFSESLLTEIYSKTKGWIAAVNILLLFDDFTHNDNIIDTNTFASYVQEEILYKLDSEVRQFLIETSIFEVLEADICNSYLDIKDSNEILTNLYNQKFLLHKTGNDSYKIHDLIRDVLKTNINDRQNLFKKASEAYIENGRAIMAVEFLIISKFYNDALELMRVYVPKLIHKGNWITIKRWLAYFNEDKIINDAFLCVLTAELKVYNSSIFEAEKYLYRAKKLYDQVGDMHGISKCYNVHARILRSQGKYKESLSKMEDAAAALAGERLDISMETALSYLFMGDFQSVEKTLLNAYKKAMDTMDNSMIAHIVACRAHFDYLKGDYTNSVARYKKAAQLSDNVYYSHFQRSCLATIYQDWGMLDYALKLAKESVNIKEKYNLLDTLPYAYYQLAHIYVDLKQFDRAEVYYNKAIKTADEIGGETFFKILSTMLLARCYIKRGLIKKTRETARSAMKQAIEEGGYIESICSLLMGIIFIQTRKIDRAKEFIARGRELLEIAKPKYFAAMLYGALAYIASFEEDEPNLIKYGLMYLDIASSSNFLQMGVSLYSMFSVVFEKLPKDRLTFAHVDFIEELNDRCAKKSLVSKFFGVQKHTALSNYNMLLKLYENKNEMPFTANLFGGFSLLKDNDEIKLRGVISLKAKQLLIFMLHKGRKVSKEEIIDAIWTESASKNIDDLFHATLYNLRKGLKKIDSRFEYINYEDGQYLLEKNVFYCIHDLYSTMLTMLSNMEKLTQKDFSLMAKILQYYNGEYLLGIDKEWAGKSKAYYEMLYEKVSLKVSEFYVKNSEEINAISLLYKLIELNSYTEDGYYLLIKALKISGQTHVAKRLYKEYEETLINELGILPSDRIKNLVM